ncbi:hypothetical protein R1sor_003344 [Riccia sorocarpa]|uniref:Uncharacterized protein n=1 Tax=Riccia sorocarpa TaxID=122646 RepID=A0ABD3H1B1_9MARC
MARDGPQAGATLHFELYTEEDEDNYMRWKWISKKEAHRVLRGIDAALLQRSGLHDALWMDWSRPEEGTEFVKEFVLNWDDDRKQSTVDGQVVPVNVDVIRNVFGLAEGRTAPRSARHYEDLSDWVHERSKSHKTWFANDVFFPEWRPIIQLINVVLLGKQKPLEVTSAFIYILKNKVGPANLNEDLDWDSYFSEKIREEIKACRKQMRAAGKRKFRPTCIGIVILHILRVLGVVDDDQLVHSDSEEGLPEPQQSESPDRYTQSSSPGVIRGDSSSSPASGRSGTQTREEEKGEWECLKAEKGELERLKAEKSELERLKAEMQETISWQDAHGVSSDNINELKQDRDKLEKEIAVLEEVRLSDFVHVLPNASEHICPGGLMDTRRVYWTAICPDENYLRMMIVLKILMLCTYHAVAAVLCLMMIILKIIKKHSSLH